MDINLIIERTRDVDLISSILTDEDIFDSISEDGSEAGDFKPDVDSELWIKIECDNDLIGVCNFHATNKITIQGHIHILKQYRREHSLKAANKIYIWLLNNSAFLKLVVEIPSCHTNVMKYCKAIGFNLEGINRESYLKNGKALDQALLGITRKEIEEFLK